MERRKARISAICVSIIVILSTILAVVGIANLSKSKFDDSNLGSLVVDETKEDYLGGVAPDYNPVITGWKAISSASELRMFLLGIGQYARANGYLTSDITDFNWVRSSDTEPDYGTSGSAYLAPNVQFDRKLDGFGHTVTMSGDAYSAKNIVVNAQEGGLKLGVLSDEQREGFSNKGQKLHYSAFGGFVSTLETNGEIRNLKFVIDSDHTFTHEKNDDGNIVNYVTSFGGLVGVQNDGIIDNVAVTLADNRQIGVSHSSTSVKRPADNAVINGLVVGTSLKGTLSNVSSVMRSGSQLISKTVAGYWGSGDYKNGVTYAGGVVGNVEKDAKVDQLAIIVEENAKITSVADYSNRESGSHELVGGIAGRVAPSATIAAAMVSGKLNFLATGTRTGEMQERQKNVFVASGGQPQNMFYVSATGGSNTKEAGTGSTTSNDVTKGYTNNQQKIMINAEDKIDNKVTVYFNRDRNGFKAFLEQDWVLWSSFGLNRYAEEIKGSAALNYPSNVSSDNFGNKKTTIEVGQSVNGDIDFYKEIGSSDPNYNSAPQSEDGKRWLAMSDQARAARNGGNESLLYYDETLYEVKMIVGGRIYGVDEGVEIINIGDLKNAMSSHNGRPVKLYNTSKVAFAHSGLKQVVYVDNIDENSYDKDTQLFKKFLSIQKRRLWVHESGNYERGVTNIFGGVSVMFTKYADINNPVEEEGSGLIGSDSIKWQNDHFYEGKSIDLNVAGPQMLRPSSNNYIIMCRETDSGINVDKVVGSYYTAIITSHTIQVGEGVYINGSFVDGKYEIKNANVYDDAKKNEQKRKITVSLRLTTNNFTATGVKIVDKNGKDVTTYKNSVGNSPSIGKTTIEWYDENGKKVTDWDAVKANGTLVKADIWINDAEIDRIYLEGINKTTYSLTVDGVEKGSFNYGERFYLQADKYRTIKDNDGNDVEQIFDGWVRKDGVTYISYAQNYSLKITQDFVVTSKYVDLPEKDGKFMHYYFDEGLSGESNQVLRICVANQEEALDKSEYQLPTKMGRTFKEWKKIPVEDRYEEGYKVCVFEATYNELSEELRKKYSVKINRDAHMTDYIYGDPIVLEAGHTYLVNEAVVEVGDEPMTIFAISDMIIDDITYGNPNNLPKNSTSMTYKSIVEVAEDGSKTYYMSITFVYGKADDKYSDDENIKPRFRNKPKFRLPGFSQDDITQYVRIGNVYQISIVMTEQELESKFGNNGAVTTFLTITTEQKKDGEYELDKDGNYVYMDVYKFREIIIFREKDPTKADN